MSSDSEDVKLLGIWRSPFVVRVRIALSVKSINYEFLEENLPSKSDLLLKSNPVHKKVPVLIHGEKPISESLVIIHYIDETWSNGPPILPGHPYDRAVARFWASYVDGKWFASVRAFLFCDGEEAKKMEEANEGTALIEEAFVTISKGQKFFGGERIGFLDIVVGSFLPLIGVIGKLSELKLIDEVKTPNLYKWAQDFSSDDVVKEYLPETEKMVELARQFFPRFKAQDQN